VIPHLFPCPILTTAPFFFWVFLSSVVHSKPPHLGDPHRAPLSLVSLQTKCYDWTHVNKTPFRRIYFPFFGGSRIGQFSPNWPSVRFPMVPVLSQHALKDFFLNEVSKFPAYLFLSRFEILSPLSFVLFPINHSLGSFYAFLLFSFLNAHVKLDVPGLHGLALLPSGDDLKRFLHKICHEFGGILRFSLPQFDSHFPSPLIAFPSVPYRSHAGAIESLFRGPFFFSVSCNPCHNQSPGGMAFSSPHSL